MYYTKTFGLYYVSLPNFLLPLLRCSLNTLTQVKNSYFSHDCSKNCPHQCSSDSHSLCGELISMEMKSKPDVQVTVSVLLFLHVFKLVERNVQIDVGAEF